MIDTAEAYAKGKSEREVGRAIKELGYRRSDWIITTKVRVAKTRMRPLNRLTEYVFTRSFSALEGMLKSCEDWESANWELVLS